MKQLHLFFLITLIMILICACSPPERKIETAVAKTVTALPTFTPYPTVKPTLTSTPIPSFTPTAMPTPIIDDLGVSLEKVQNMFEKHGFRFTNLRDINGEVWMNGKYKDEINVYLYARKSNLVKIDYAIPLWSDYRDEVPSLGDAVVTVLGDDVYKTIFSPWSSNKTETQDDFLCFDGVLIRSNYSELLDAFQLLIMLEQEYDYGYGGC